MTLAAISTIFAKALTSDLHVIEILWLRLVLGCLFIWPLFRRSTGKLIPGFGKLHVLRAVILIGMTGLWFLALSLGPVSQAAAMSYTYPIFVLVFAAVFFGQKIRGLDVASLVISFAGIIVIFAKGWADATFTATDAIQLCVVLSTCLLIAIRITIEKVMSVELDPEDILLGSMAIATIMVAPMVVPVWQNPSLEQVAFLFGLALTATLSQLFVIQLVRIGSWSVVSIFAFWEVLAAIALGIVIFGESLALATALGAVLIVVGGLLQVVRR